jgi:hypothetical protein
MGISKSDKDNSLSITDTGFKLALDSVVTKVIQMTKNRRIFYGGLDGHVHTLEVGGSVLNKIFNKRQLQPMDLQKESIFMRLLPSFLKFTDRK